MKSSIYKTLLCIFLVITYGVDAQKNGNLQNPVINNEIPVTWCCPNPVLSTSNFYSFNMTGYEAEACPGCVVQITAYCINAQSWTWSWADGSGNTATSNGAAASHQYLSPGVYIVTLTPTYVSPTTPTNCAKKQDFTIKITVSYTSCVNSCCVNFPFTGSGFSSFSVSASPSIYTANICPGNTFVVGAGACGNTSFFVWDFGDGSPAVNGFSVTHQYNSSGTYTIVARAMGPCCSNTQSIVVSADAEFCPPCCQGYYLGAAGFQSFVNNGPGLYNAVICPNTPFTMNLAGCQLANSYTWDFGDGSPVSTQAIPTHQYASAGTYTILVSGTGLNPLCSIPEHTVTVNVSTSPIVLPPLVCTTLSLSLASCYVTSGITYTWDFGDGTFGAGTSVNHNYNSAGNYVVTVIPSSGSPITQNITVQTCAPPPCVNCIGSFAPDPGDYIVSVWVREDILPQPLTYSNARIELSFINDPTVYTFATNVTKNKIIEGWQRIEEPFTIPPFATHINIRMINAGAGGAPDAYFDDIRIFPKDGQMKTYVYDPILLRLTAILDENNYATFYEYDEEGKLIRVKKETEKGIMTVNENSEGLKKQ